MLDGPVGVLGGTFDPIHYGHLRSALELLTDLRLSEVRFIPVRQPPHRELPMASPAQRFAMVRIAVVDQPNFLVDDRELRREGISYMVDTLTSLKSELKTRPLCLMVGMDAFQSFHQWHRWMEIPTLAHIIVMQRPGTKMRLAEELRQRFQGCQLEDFKSLREQTAGGILFQTVTQLDISATQIRQLLAEKRSPRYLLPDEVLAFISERQLYSAPPQLPSNEFG